MGVFRLQTDAVTPDSFQGPLPRSPVPMKECAPCVHILASGRNGTLYKCVTSNLVGRVRQHRAGTFGGFTKRYRIHRLIWFDVADTMEAAIATEKRIKKWPREYKLNLIERENPIRDDLAINLGLRPMA